MWHVSSRSGVATLRTAIHLLLTYLHVTGVCAFVTNDSFVETDGWIDLVFATEYCFHPVTYHTLCYYKEVRVSRK